MEWGGGGGGWAHAVTFQGQEVRGSWKKLRNYRRDAYPADDGIKDNEMGGMRITHEIYQK